MGAGEVCVCGGVQGCRGYIRLDSSWAGGLAGRQSDAAWAACEACAVLARMRHWCCMSSTGAPCQPPTEAGAVLLQLLLLVLGCA